MTDSKECLAQDIELKDRIRIYEGKYPHLWIECKSIEQAEQLKQQILRNQEDARKFRIMCTEGTSTERVLQEIEENKKNGEIVKRLLNKIAEHDAHSYTSREFDTWLLLKQILEDSSKTQFQSSRGDE